MLPRFAPVYVANQSSNALKLRRPSNLIAWFLAVLQVQWKFRPCGVAEYVHRLLMIALEAVEAKRNLGDVVADS